MTDELVEKILRPGLEPGAADVFLEFVCYSDGPLPEELLPQVKCPVLIAWGDKDPWEPIELGRAYGNFETVEDFVVLPDVGHCPQKKEACRSCLELIDENPRVSTCKHFEKHEAYECNGRTGEHDFLKDGISEDHIS